MSKTLTTSVAFTDAQNNILAGGTVIFQLNMGAKLISNGQIVNVVKITFTLDATGKMPAGQTINANDELQPTGTFYVVTIFNSNGLLVRGPENWILSGASPIDLSTITSSSIPDPGLANPIIGNPSAPQSITGQSLTLTSSAPFITQGTGTHSGTETFQSLIQLAGGTCSSAGISTALAAVSVGGTVDARACTTAFTWSSIVTISSPVNLYLPCANVTFTTQLLAINADDVHIHGCGSGSTGQLSVYANSTAGATYTASGLGSSTDAIVVIKTGARATLDAIRISGVSIDNLLLNMNSVGRRAIYTSSCWSCKLDRVVAYNLNCSDGGIYQEAFNGTGTPSSVESYFMRMDDVTCIINQTNTTCHPFYFDASKGEIAYGTYTNLFAEGYPQAAGSGSDSVYVNTGATLVNQSFDQCVFTNLKTQDPTTGAYGIKLQCRGNFASQTNGRCFNIQFLDAQPERIFSTGGTGTAMGCVNAAGTADGTGCGFIVNQNLSSGGWANNEDVANLGAGYMSVSSNSAGLQGPIFRQSGLHQVIGVSGTTQFERIDPTFTPTANTQTGFSVLVIPNTTNAGNFTGASLQGLTVDMGDGTHTGGTFGASYGIFVNGFCTSWASPCWSLYNNGPAGNHMDSFLEIGTASAPNPGGVASGGRFWYDQTNQRMSLSNNNASFSFLPSVIASGTSTLTSNATLASVTSQTAITSTATGAATTDSIEWSYASAPGAGDSLCIVSAYCTSGNVNFVRSNPTAASQNVSAIVINWRVIR